ncbi:MAG TPA: AraC family transcriptional regulator [Alistipes sp.]|uniref:helix-turn-helix domain-containing protein n=1 Tax=Alistipes sp. UBA6068 TaxID=1946012 RepID=UPI000E9E9591|nr:helix-turn-helix domain-containing protein [Alistipes sp. UBA6068]HBV50274.1 AraC family transcriptional regulator [Alistipes sp.]
MDSKQQPNTAPIASFSLGELISIAGGSRPAPDFLIVHSDASQLDAFRFPCRINAFFIGLGHEGETEISINLNQYTLRRNTLFLIGPQSIIRTGHGGTLKGDVIVVSPQFMQRMNIGSKQIMSLILQLNAHPCIEISDEESRQLRDFIRLMDAERGVSGEFSDQLLGNLLLATLYKIGNTLQSYLEAHPAAQERSNSRADIYFRKFLQTLSEHYKEERSVGFYARELCVTPKYLTTLVKRISSKSVSEWIEIYVILEAKTLLKYSSLSIQEIAYTLNFPNQSFFGSYFKRNTGMSPSQYKSADCPAENGGGGYSLDASEVE